MVKKNDKNLQKSGTEKIRYEPILRENVDENGLDEYNTSKSSS